MNKADLQRLSQLRVKEATVLFQNGHFPGAYYLLGYAVECALKACVAKQIKKYDFPDRKLVNDSYTHDLEKLLNISGLKSKFDKAAAQNSGLNVNWALVKDWTEESRYQHDISDAKVRDFFTAVTNRTNGVLPWVKKWW